MSLDPKHRYRDMRALGQELLTLAGQRTRITWGLTFGEVAAAVRAHHARELDEEAIALAQTRAPKRTGRVSAWPLLAAACVGVATVTAFSLSNRGGARSSEPAPPASPALAAAPPAMVVRPLEATRAAPDSARAEPAAEAAPTPPRAEPPRAVADGAGDRSRATARADEDSTPEADEGDDNGSASPRQRARRPRPRVQPRAVEPPPPEPPRELPDTPEWIIEHDRPRSRSHGSSPVQMGTNDAPIFD